jgi:hypothetical protein
LAESLLVATALEEREKNKVKKRESIGQRHANPSANANA